MRTQKPYDENAITLPTISLGWQMRNTTILIRWIYFTFFSATDFCFPFRLFIRIRSCFAIFCVTVSRIAWNSTSSSYWNAFSLCSFFLLLTPSLSSPSLPGIYLCCFATQSCPLKIVHMTHQMLLHMKRVDRWWKPRTPSHKKQFVCSRRTRMWTRLWTAIACCCVFVSAQTAMEAVVENKKSIKKMCMHQSIDFLVVLSRFACDFGGWFALWHMECVWPGSSSSSESKNSTISMFFHWIRYTRCAFVCMSPYERVK